MLFLMRVEDLLLPWLNGVENKFKAQTVQLFPSWSLKKFTITSAREKVNS